MSGSRQTGARWRLFMGAEHDPGRGVRFRVWAPAARTVAVAWLNAGRQRSQNLDPEGEGLFSCKVTTARPGTLYRFVLDDGEAFPDPYSRCQPDGVHGPSQVVDPLEYVWRDHGWRGIGENGLVIYECHVGTFTAAGTFEAIIDELPELSRLGITALELMPVAEFAGRRNWGYDGVDLYAPSMSYGGPLGMKRLIDAAHGHGIAVLLDVVYNHLGPSGNYLRAYATQYFTERYQTPWGEALNYDGPDSSWVRHYVVENACYWLNEYHADGLRLDATHAIFDQSPRHILREIAERARESVGPERRIVVIAEDGRNDVGHIRPVQEGGRGLDGVWADDFHHAVRTLLTGEHDGYYEDYDGDLAGVATTIREGFLYQGGYSKHLRRPKGTRVTDEPAQAFVFCLENHDQVGNRAFGDRLNHVVDEATYLTATAVLLLAPETPLIFMGQEFAASAPFRYFTDHDPDLGRLVAEGRRNEFRTFDAFRDPGARARIPDPQAESTFLASKLDLTERAAHGGIYRCYRDLISLRRNDPVLRWQERREVQAQPVGEKVLAVHRRHGGEQRLLLANFGGDVRIALPSDLAWLVDAPAGWRIVWSSGDPAYHDLPKAQPALERSSLFVPATTAVLLRGT